MPVSYLKLWKAPLKRIVTYSHREKTSGIILEFEIFVCKLLSAVDGC